MESACTGHLGPGVEPSLCAEEGQVSQENLTCLGTRIKWPQDRQWIPDLLLSGYSTLKIASRLPADSWQKGVGTWGHAESRAAISICREFEVSSFLEIQQRVSVPGLLELFHVHG
ncbi:transmembrane protein 250 isoform X2 [Pezoporus wallicus]|uniref:transmembrane protein 250 isoform X2 n=1 Tax=Pezoporus wallicus TaxID=35540 RepID=UPI002551B1DD|nr:transmembrane protein 250 isoform X2 [Pezoporus wallicus]